MLDSRGHRDPDTGSFIDWTREPFFNFDSEVDALETLQELGEEYRAALKQVEQVKRYLHYAVRAADRTYEGGEKVHRTAIVNHCGLARQTVYTMLQTDPTAQSGTISPEPEVV